MLYRKSDVTSKFGSEFVCQFCLMDKEAEQKHLESSVSG